jgi:hypothetical protein
MTAHVVSVSSSPVHAFSKPVEPYITLVAGLGAQGGAHCGVTVKHRSRVAQDPSQPNLRQVHLIHSELFVELAGKGFQVTSAQLGENIMRNPCAQLDGYQRGLTAAVLDRTPDGKLVRKAGVMSVVLTGGVVQPGDPIRVVLPVAPHRAMERV